MGIKLSIRYFIIPESAIKVPKPVVFKGEGWAVERQVSGA